MPRTQFTLRALLVLMLAVACWFGGTRFERERQRREDVAAALATIETERAAALDRIRQRAAFIAAERAKMEQQKVVEAERRKKAEQEIRGLEKRAQEKFDALNVLLRDHL